MIVHPIEPVHNNVMKNKRLKYIIATIILLIIEILIAIFVHDNFIRPYIGDVLVVIVMYTFVRIFVPDKCRLLPVFIFVFSMLVEFLQLINIVEILGLNKDGFLGILIGSTFDIKDIICYGVGCVIVGVYDSRLFKD